MEKREKTFDETSRYKLCDKLIIRGGSCETFSWHWAILKTDQEDLERQFILKKEKLILKQ